MRGIIFILSFLMLDKALAQSAYPSYESRLKRLRTKADSIMEAGSSVKPADALTVSALKRKAPTSQPQNFNNIYKEAKPAVYTIAMVYRAPGDTSSRLNFASAFAVTPDGICISNYHVLQAYSRTLQDGKYALVAMNGNDEAFAVTGIAALSQENDLAIIQLDVNKKIPYLGLAAEDAEVGDRIYVLSNPQGIFNFFTTGIVSNKYYASRNLMSITADYAVGSSGAPILDAKGNVVGIVSFTTMVPQDENGRMLPQMVVKNTIPVSSLKSLLDHIQKK